MPEYLEKEAFKAWMKENITENSMILTAIDYAPFADAEPVIHGYWYDSLDGTAPYCSICGRTHRCVNRTPPYCPNCGAKMKKRRISRKGNKRNACL